MKNPIPLAPMGAGQCVLGVSPLVQIPVPLPVSGVTELKLQVPATAPQVAFDMQWLVAKPGANPAGLLTSQVGAVVIR